jgi:hypothetical protein
MLWKFYLPTNSNGNQIWRKNIKTARVCKIVLKFDLNFS